MLSDKQPSIESDALKANILETAVEEVVIDPSFQVLADIVRDYRGIQSNLENLLYEISHPFRNWNIILPQLRGFVLKNIEHYRKHKNGPEAFSLFSSIFINAALDSKKNEQTISLAFESLLAYVEKLVVKESPELKAYEEALENCFNKLSDLDDETLLFIVQGQHPIKKIATHLIHAADKLHEQEKPVSFKLHAIAKLSKRILSLNYKYWLNEEDPYIWLMAECGDMCAGWQAGKLFSSISHKEMRARLEQLNGVDIKSSPADGLNKILELPGHMDIVRLYREVPNKLVDEQAAEDKNSDRFIENRKLLFLFRIMDTSGLGLIHEETLREINRSLIQLIRQQTFEEIKSFLLTTLKLLKVNVRKYPHTSLQCIQVLGTEVFKRGNSRLVETFLWETVRFGFQYANVIGVDEDWQPITNPAHLANIRVWLNLIMQEPKWCSTLFSALIINIKLTGTCVKDTDLFQRDITQLLNHPIEPVYNLVKQFTKLMPVFFNEIGAEGLLRDVSTEIDEIHNRQDKLIHFLRKQSHVESSNLIVDFIRSIFQFWETRDKKYLLPHLPPQVLIQVQTEGNFIDTPHTLMVRVLKLPQIKNIDSFITIKEQELNDFLETQKDVPESEIRRFSLLISMFKLVHQKYDLSMHELRDHLHQAVNAGFPEMEKLLQILDSGDTFRILNELLRRLEGLKKTILSEKTYEAKEDIYHKRHIAVDIPSVYGQYRERKFDALGLTFRLENLANVYLENLPKTVNLSFITRATFIRIIKCLRIYLRALNIDGITSRRLETHLSLLSSSLGIKRFSFTQYLDIFRGFSEGVKDVIYAYYTNIHQSNLSIIVPQIDSRNLLEKYRSLWVEDDLGGNINRLSETFMRDLIAGTFGLQHLDNFITKIYQTLESQKEHLDKKSLDLLMTYNPERVISFLSKKNPQSYNLILLGNKGFNLTVLAADNKPVPPGFIITTEIFRCWPVVKNFYKARDEFMEKIRLSINKLEKQTDKRYGNPENPLLLSVRSGAAISMPGMMATIHNIGLNEEIVQEFAKANGKEYLAWDNYRRFLQSWAMAADIPREVFQALMDRAKTKYGVLFKHEFSPEQMKELALEYQKTIRNLGIGIPDDPWLQLISAVEMVLGTWEALKTREYRELMDVSESWGTAIIVQTMVFGNLGPESGSGVLFTAHPYRKVRRVALWGDYAPGDQGEDIVSGLVKTYPISVEQAEIDGRDRDYTLENMFPKIYETLLQISRELVYEKQWNPQEIEFTFEGPEPENLYILQTRDMITIKKKEHFNVFEERNLDKYLLGAGIGVSGSALSGRAVFTLENIQELRQSDPDTPLILIRQDTVPEDIKEISMVEGLLTARGGQTSHASVVATRLEKTCVVGCSPLQVYESEERCKINDHIIRFGDEISIDGRKGLFLTGKHAIREEIHILPI